MGAMLLGVSSCATVEEAGTKVEAAMSKGENPGTPLALKSEPPIRVRVEKRVRGVVIDATGPVVVRPLGAGKSSVMSPPLAVTSSGSGMRVKDRGGVETSWPMGSDLEFVFGEGRRTAGSMKVDGRPYPGYVTVRGMWSESPEVMDVVVSMGVESYLPGVVVAEMFNDWPRQAYEAQAVAARSYAIHERERALREGRSFDVESTTADQAYAGSTRHVTASEAVRATRGMVLMDGDRVLRAYYSSCCGGRPASAGEVWSVGPGYEFNKAGPLQGKGRAFACSSSKHYRWEVNRTDEDVSKRLRAWGHANSAGVARVGRVRSIKAATFNDAKRPSTYRVVDDAGREFTLTAEELRVGLNYGAAGLPAVTEETRVRSGDLDVEFWAGQVRIHGRGFGHGVGMCQYCAKGFAEQGQDWRTMMRAFFPGAEVRKAY